jgi:hypothetical protein
MKNVKPYLAAVFAALGILAAVAATSRAETATLEIKKLSASGQQRVLAGRPAEYIFRSTYPQSFNATVRTSGSNSISFPGMEEQLASFKKLVKKEPKYESDSPFRGVAKLGTQEYPFVLDAVPEKPKAKQEKESEKSKPAVKSEKKDADADDAEENESATGTLQLTLTSDDADEKTDAEESKADEAKKEKTPKAIRYNRLYIDMNRNGDLTDDKVIEAQGAPGLIMGGSYTNFSFPQVELTIDVDGTPVEYAFTMNGYMNVQKEFSYAGVQLHSAAYREGEITLDGKTHRVALVDFNSNGRFDDQIMIRPEVRGSGGQVYPQQGDMLLIDPDAKTPDSPYNPAESKFRNYVSKLVNLEGRYYDVKITPAGDKLTLEPSTVPLGKLANPNDRYTAVIYGDQGFLKISGSKDEPASVPAGEWKLLSYSIDLTELPKPNKPDEEKPKSEDLAEKKDSSPNALSAAIKNLLNSQPAAAPNVIRRSVVSAQATGDFKTVKVVADETVEMPFGPPYKPVVTSYPSVDTKQKPIIQLSLSLVGSAGESCSDMTVKGSRPGKPQFTITDPEGKVAQTGNFEYG